jgi:hypothetical protein
MTKNSQDELARAYATLSSLRKNIEQITADIILETYVNEYHTALNKLEEIGIEVSEFRIPNSLVKPRVTSRQADYSTGVRVSHDSYSDEKYVDKALILTKLDTILSYFEFITSEKPREIGFRTPKKQ